MALINVRHSAVACGMSDCALSHAHVQGRANINLGKTISCTNAIGTMMNNTLKAKMLSRNSQTCNAMMPNCLMLKRRLRQYGVNGLDRSAPITKAVRKRNNTSAIRSKATLTAVIHQNSRWSGE